MTHLPSRVSAAVVSQRPEGGWLFGVAAKRTYRIERGVCCVAPAQVPLVDDPVIDEGTGQLRHDSDRIVQRNAVDVVVTGRARWPSGSGAFAVSFRVGEFFQEILVFGERRVQIHANGTVSFSAPAPVDEVPLAWEEAYGGVDQVGLAEIGDPFVELASATNTPIAPTQSLFAYPRNPFGKGYVIEPSPAAIEACRLPRLEFPWSRVSPENVIRRHFVTWPLAPIPAGTGWLSYSAFPRSAQLCLPAPLFDEASILPEHFYEVQSGWLRPTAFDVEVPLGERLDVSGAAQGAALGMRARRVLPGDCVVLTNIHPIYKSWSFTLPGHVPRMAYRLPDRKSDELTPQIRCLVIAPEEDTISVVWTATRPLNEPLTSAQLARVEHGVIWS